MSGARTRAGYGWGMTPAQCRAARGLLNWTQKDLARRSGVTINSIRTFEAGKTTPIRNNMAALVGALEQSGAMLVPEDDGAGPGVRLRKGAVA